MEPLNWFMLALPGIGLVVLGVPLLLRRIPRNPIYGVRFPSTLARDEVWYPINARGGRDMIAIGVLNLCLIGVAFLLGAGWSPPLRFLMPTILTVIALIVDAIILWRASENLKRQL